ncbi:DUF3006 domain-containing protein [Salicibibacter cibarius]|uniref:DUF3006 domain-containing protein n=1 Tax=Salicibibacter cibarius TaxID=2743000 RepID=A0A7T6Z2N2_9BACI|nr:DUF3006 domain-containing protein [Salicibibacter cibarius]QQK75855.1 DUF3006 domain-containing protein [Salicibibacter cibarius]
MAEKAVLDRIEDGKHAVLLIGDEEKEKIIPSSELPEGSKEGMWFQVDLEDSKIVKISIDQAETKKREKRISDKMAKLKKKKGGKF